MTRSSAMIAAALSAKSCNPGAISMSAMPGGGSRPGPTWHRLFAARRSPARPEAPQAAPGATRRGSGRDRAGAPVQPAETLPILEPGFVAAARSRPRICSGIGVQIGSFRRIVGDRCRRGRGGDHRAAPARNCRRRRDHLLDPGSLDKSRCSSRWTRRTMRPPRHQGRIAHASDPRSPRPWSE